MLALNEIKVGKVIRINNEPYVLIKTDHHKMGRGGAVLKTKLKNLITGNLLEKTFQGSDKAEEAETETKKGNYLYKDDNEVYFMDNVSFEQFSFPLDQVGEQIIYLKEGTDADVLYFEDRPVAVSLPIKMKLKVLSAPPGVKGNSAGNVNKIVELETGAKIAVPMFINEGDEIIINTEDGEYTGRA
ncbi:MAG: elongation factor P [Patescibacteria group bacterium]|nr:elongation factor P [Patescibacteria group bacterium]MDD4610744.1 elongation factor P [Patescibacteria group bacterium]